VRREFHQLARLSDSSREDPEEKKMRQLRPFVSAQAALVWLGIVSFVLVLAPLAAARQKLRAEDVVAKHLEAVGPAQARAAAKTRIASGSIRVSFRSPRPMQVDGRAVIASEGEKLLTGMVFDNPIYPQERFAFDGSQASFSYITGGGRTALGDFLNAHNAIVKHGLVGGTITSAWPLLEAAKKEAKLEYGGTKKIEGRALHEVKYSPRGGSDLKISLFFDADTFHHIRTEYTRVIAARMGTSPDASAGQRETRYKMVEEFSDFRPAGGLTLPHNYTIELSLQTQGGTFIGAWNFGLSQFAFNQRIDPTLFRLEEPVKR
jgi:hypothetical protein